jgi:hypothetical protein
MTKRSSLYVWGCSRLKVKGMKELVQANADEKIKEDKRAVRNSWLYYPVFGNNARPVLRVYGGLLCAPQPAHTCVTGIFANEAMLLH